MAREDSNEYKSLMSNARQCDYYATCPTNGLSPESRARWAEKAAALRDRAAALPADFVDPEWRMPEWGTYGT